MHKKFGPLTEWARASTGALRMKIFSYQTGRRSNCLLLRFLIQARRFRPSFKNCRFGFALPHWQTRNAWNCFLAWLANLLRSDLAWALLYD